MGSVSLYPNEYTKLKTIALSTPTVRPGASPPIPQTPCQKMHRHLESIRLADQTAKPHISINKRESNLRHINNLECLLWKFI